MLRLSFVLGRLRRPRCCAAGLALLLASTLPAGGTGLAEIFSHGGESCPAADIDLLTKPTPDLFDVRVVEAPYNPILVGWPAVTVPSGIVPLGKDTTGRYFYYRTKSGQEKIGPLIGVSPDIACAMHTGNGDDTCIADMTKASYYKKVLNDLRTRGLNKMRLLVSYAGVESSGPKNDGVCAKPVEPNDYPFLYNAEGGFWQLDDKNTEFFKILRDVVAGARARNIMVEVTFFAPWFGVWNRGPYYGSNARVDLNDDGDFTDAGELIGLLNRNEFVDRACPPEGSPPDQICEAQKRVIQWTVEELWNFPNLYWEIANEPENPKPGADPKPDCNPTTAAPAVNAQDVEAWQTRMIEILVAAEEPHVSEDPLHPEPDKLAHPHLIAVQPFSKAGATFFMQNPNVTIINGHYTQVAQGQANLGAIELVRGYNQRATAPAPNTVRIICSNEGKISGYPCNPATQNCSAFTADGTQNDGLFGDPDAARAEAYQFMASQGGCFDHFGYYMNSNHGGAIRIQLSSLLALMTSPLTNLTQLTPAAPGDAQAPTWINFKNYKDSVSQDRTYWSALEPRAGATGVQTYFAYVHHSKPSGAAFDGYDPEIRTGGAGSPYYSTTHKICFSWPANTAFKVDWICPKTGQCKTDSKTWTGTTGCANDGSTSAMPGAMVITPPATFNCPYEYDLAIRIRRTNQGSCG